jgi:hypothetical protein
MFTLFSYFHDCLFWHEFFDAFLEGFYFMLVAIFLCTMVMYVLNRLLIIVLLMYLEAKFFTNFVSQKAYKVLGLVGIVFKELIMI